MSFPLIHINVRKRNIKEKTFLVTLFSSEQYSHGRDKDLCYTALREDMDLSNGPFHVGTDKLINALRMEKGNEVVITEESTLIPLSQCVC